MNLQECFPQKSRFNDPYLNRFLQPDTIIPDQYNPQSLNRFSYVGNNPINRTDPTGHKFCDGEAEDDCRSGNTKYIEKTDPISKLNPARHPKDKGTNLAESFFRNVSTVFDVGAWGIDLYDAGVVIAGGIVGAGIALPFAPISGVAVPAVTGLAGMGLAELYVQAPMVTSNILSTVSTAATITADIIAGDTNLKKGIIGTQTLNSVGTTSIGWADREAITVLGIQSLAVLNDLGWTSFPFPTRSK